MAHRKVQEFMTAEVVTVTLDTRFKALAGLMVIHSVSALPVLDPEGHVAGVVSDFDLLRKQEFQQDPTRTAQDVMTSPAVTVSSDATIVAAARLMDRHRIKRLVVVDADGRWPASSPPMICCASS